MSAVLRTTTSITMYLPIALKLRIEAGAKSDERSVSQYMSRILDKIVPPLSGPSPQLDIETLIAEKNLPPRVAAHVKRAVKRATTPRKPK
jgi:hypothetical protein